MSNNRSSEHIVTWVNGDKELMTAWDKNKVTAREAWKVTVEAHRRLKEVDPDLKPLKRWRKGDE